MRWRRWDDRRQRFIDLKDGYLKACLQCSNKDIYYAEIQVLADTKTKHGVQPAVWVSELGKGRICCMTPAHVTENLTCDGFTRIMKNAIKWCSTD